MKKITIVLLILLIVASCFALTSCDESSDCVDGKTHYFLYSYLTCEYCHKDYCTAYGHQYLNKDSQTGKYYCHKCGQLKSEGASAADGELPIGTVILIGAITLVVGLIMHRIGISTSSPFFMRAPMVAFVIFTLGAFLAYGVICGIIMAVFFVLYIVGYIKLNNKHLGYNDYV